MQILRFGIRNQLLLILLGVFLYFHFASPFFATGFNLITLGREGAEFGLICIGVTLVMILGRLDISVGSVMAVSALIMIIGYKTLEIHWGYLIPICLVFGVLIGTINGLLTAIIGVPSFIATLGTLIILRGLMQWAASTEWMREANSVFSTDPAFQFIGGGDVGGVVPLSVVLLAILFAAVLFVLRYTRIGTAIYAFGGNFQAATRAGIRIKLIEVGVFAFSGVCAALAGVLLASRLDSVTYQTGQYLEFQVLIAVILGGTSIAGGVGSIWGTILGISLIAILNNGMVMTATDRDVQDIVVALFLLFALFSDRLTYRLRGGSGTWKMADMGQAMAWIRQLTVRGGRS